MLQHVQFVAQTLQIIPNLLLIRLRKRLCNAS